MNTFKKCCYFGILFLFLTFNNTFSQSIDTTQFFVQTKQGIVKGSYENETYVWKGINYAKSTAGEKRFQAPEPPENWEGIKLATAYGNVAPQETIIKSGLASSEDCLNLNIWSPDTKNTKRPVMLWIHGGAFYTGSGSLPIYNGTKLSQKGDLVIVTINYRLGALGFLYLDEIKKPEDKFESNLGIKDQIAALKWVKENIEQFGGDPNNITIFGQSAGAASVLTLMATSAAKGLFEKAIAESPAPNQYWMPHEGTSVTKRYLAMLGVSENNLSDLYKIPADSLVKVGYEMIHKFSPQIPGIGTFAPTIEGCFITQIYSDTTCAEQRQGIPLLLGTNKNEMNLFNKMDMIPFSAKENELQRLIPGIRDDEVERIFSLYKKQVMKEQRVSNIITDGVFLIPCIQVADELSKANPTYMYRFDWTSLPLYVTGFKTCHALDVFFVFDAFDSKIGKKVTLLTRKKIVQNVADDIQTAWVNFARTGNPNDVGIETWKKYDSSERATMVIQRKAKLKFDPNQRQRKAWEGIDLD